MQTILIKKIRIIEFICLMLLLIVTAVPFGIAEDEGFKSIFNGQDLTGWNGDTRYWSVQDGAITGRSSKENPLRDNTFIIWDQGPVDDFELRLMFKIDGGNSGIQYRSQHTGNYVVSGYQADIEDGKTYMGALYDELGRGMLANRGEKTVVSSEGQKSPERFGDSTELLAKVNMDDWNEYVIIAQGNHMTHKINGHVMAEVIDNQSSESERSGILALQLHSGNPMTIQFKDIRLKRLPLEDKKKIVLIAGQPSHAPGEHEHNAGVWLLTQCLDEVDDVVTASYYNGWPSDPTVFDNVNSILLYMDGGSDHPAIQEERLQEIGELMKKGVGLACIHYAVEVPKDKGGQEFMDWIGGYYETYYSINPHWTAEFTEITQHPVTRGVEPFTIRDEWYFNIRFRAEMNNIVPLLVSIPPDDVRRTEAASQNLGRPEIVSWCVERSDGGRGFGFTGAHFHKNWGNDNFRTLVLNAICWTAHVEIPKEGIKSTVTPEDLQKNLDEKRRRRD